MRAAVQEYYTQILLAIDVLERRLGRNVYVSAIISTDDPAVIAEDGYDKE